MTDHPFIEAYVGRIGGLAVALGVGAAVATGVGCGIAHADETGVSRAADPSPSSAESGVRRSAEDTSSRRDDAPPRTKEPSRQSVSDDDDIDDVAIEKGPANRRASDESDATESETTTARIAAVAPPPGDDPAEPPASSALIALTALPRREVGTASSADAPPPAASMTAVTETSWPPADAGFTGRPSPVAELFVAGLRLFNPILSTFGVSLNGSSSRVPIFTDGIPPSFLRHGLDVKSSEYQGWKVWTLTPEEPSGKVVIGLHGGSFIGEASIFHWWTYTDMARDTGATVVVPLYPLANEEGTGGTAETVVPVTADFIAQQVAIYGGENVSVFGDSAGGSIALAALQQLVLRCAGDRSCLADQMPGRLVLLAPSLDVSGSNPNIALVDDPLLDPEASRRNGKLWARGLETIGDPDGTRNPLASPIFGSLAGLPPTTVYAGSLDQASANVVLLQEKAAATPGADFTFELRNGQIHDWIIFAFLPDAIAERPGMYRALGLLPEASRVVRGV